MTPEVKQSDSQMLQVVNDQEIIINASCRIRAQLFIASADYVKTVLVMGVMYGYN